MGEPAACACERQLAIGEITVALVRLSACSKARRLRGDACGGNACGGNPGGGNACGSNACGSNACGGNACGDNACGATREQLLWGNACGGNACGGNACGGNACGSLQSAKLQQPWFVFQHAARLADCGVKLAGATLAGTTLAGATLAGQRLRGQRLRGQRLRGQSLLQIGLRLPENLKEKFGLIVDLTFWRKRALGAPTNRFPLVWEKSSDGKWLKTAFENNTHVPVFRVEMLVTQHVHSSSRHLVTPMIYIRFCVWLGLFVYRRWLKELWDAPDFFFFGKLWYSCSPCCSWNNKKPE